MNKRTLEEIAAMAEHLQQEKKTTSEFSVFGDNNWKSTDKMLDVLAGRYPTQDDIYRDEDSRDRTITSMMLLTFDWMNGDVDDDDLI